MFTIITQEKNDRVHDQIQLKQTMDINFTLNSYVYKIINYIGINFTYKV